MHSSCLRVLASFQRQGVGNVRCTESFVSFTEKFVGSDLFWGWDDHTLCMIFLYLFPIHSGCTSLSELWPCKSWDQHWEGAELKLDSKTAVTQFRRSVSVDYKFVLWQMMKNQLQIWKDRILILEQQNIWQYMWSLSRTFTSSFCPCAAVW